MLLKWLLNFLAALVLFRVLRRWMRPRPTPRARTRSRRRLDPDQAVSAHWSEVPEEGRGDGPG